MSGGSSTHQVLHTALETTPGDRIVEAHLSDQHRLAVVLQAAALLSHLSAADWRLTTPWPELQVDTSGMLRGARAEPGDAPTPAQFQLTELCLMLFRAEVRVAGRGQARRIARQLIREWRRCLWPIPADRLVIRIQELAPFLRSSTFAACRRALVAELVGGDERRLVIAGRGRCELRILAKTGDRLAAESLLMRPDSPCRDLSVNSPSARAGDGKLAAARRCFARGQFRQAAELLAGLPTFEARVLRADCRRLMGNLGAAQRVVEDLASRRTSAGSLLDLAEVAVALYRDLGAVDDQITWMDKVLRVATTESRPRAELLAAEIAHRCQREEAVMRYLAAAAPICRHPTFCWRWYRLRALVFLERGEAEAAQSALKTALGGSRRTLAGFQAAELWRQLALIHVELGDLAGGQRAASHALRLLGTVEDERRQIRALRLLLEIRLRRGIGAGTSAVLQTDGVGPEDSTLVALWARWDLLRGRPAAALHRIRRFDEQGHGVGTAAEAAVLKLLESRALGWLGRAQEAKESLEGLPESTWKGLEREELPAVWAHSGDWRRAREFATGTGLDELWRGLLDRAVVEEQRAKDLARLSAYRSARVVFDMGLLAPEMLPEEWREQASRTLRWVGAGPLAERLGRQRSGPWPALEEYLTHERADSSDISALFCEAGYFDVHLSFESEFENRVLVPGRGGELRLTAPTCGGRLVMRTRALDPALRTIFALAVREYRPHSEEGPRAPRLTGILGESEALRRALHRLERLAASDVAVLIQGETGTGKELAARQLHVLGPRASRTFVPVNCAALSESLLLSDLFGQVRGAFTGADRDRAGLFETAAGGTVFLDEIGDLPHTAQGKILRVLQEGEVRRLGESLPRRVDIRVVAATHRDLGAMVVDGRFRQDLYYRLKVGSVVLPPLRERGHDVLLLADHFLAPVGLSLTYRARQRLLQHLWPGNVRELRNVLQVAVALTNRDDVDIEHLELPREKVCGRLGYHQQVEEFRRNLVKQALAATAGNRAEAARRLDLSRQALSYLVRNLGLS